MQNGELEAKGLLASLVKKEGTIESFKVQLSLNQKENKSQIPNQWWYNVLDVWIVNAGIIVKRAPRSSSVGAYSRYTARDLGSIFRHLESKLYMRVYTYVNIHMWNETF